MRIAARAIATSFGWDVMLRLNEEFIVCVSRVEVDNQASSKESTVLEVLTGSSLPILRRAIAGTAKGIAVFMRHLAQSELLKD